MTAKDGKPCKKCGGMEWRKSGHCVACGRERGYLWYCANRDRFNELQRKRYWANRDKSCERSRRWRKENPDKRSGQRHKYIAKKKGNGGSFTTAEWKALCEQYDNRCLRCGRDDIALTVDHVIPIDKGGTSNIDNIQPLCFSCNSGKKNRHIDYRTKPGVERWIQKSFFQSISVLP